MTVFLIDTDNLQPQIIETEGGLQEWRRLLKCDLIGIVSYSLEGRTYDIIIDDEGLFKDRAKPTILDKNNKPLLVGNAIICNYDGNGGEASLTSEDLLLLKDHLYTLTEETEKENPDKWLALVGFEQ